MYGISVSGTYTDLYQITMAQAYFLEGKQETPACFDYFFRKIPDGGGYVLFAGLQELLEILEDFRFSDEDIAWLREMKLNEQFIEYLKAFRFRGSIHAPREGEVVFPTMPVMRVEGNLVEAQLVETVALNFLNFQSLVATKASRMRQAAGQRILSEFGFRRAQGMGGVQATRAAFIGGFDSTSNVYAARRYGVRAEGTMAHAYIEAHDSELQAFRCFAQAHPDNCVLLVDTYDTLGSGIPNSITVGREMRDRGHKLRGVRLDSGDLAYLARRARDMLDRAGLDDVSIVASNQLDEQVIASLIGQDAPVDVFGVGTSLVTGQPDAALDGVYKLAVAGGRPRLKLSETLAKVTLPGRKQVLRLLDDEGAFYGADAVILADEVPAEVARMHHPVESGSNLAIGGLRSEVLLHPVMDAGRSLIPRLRLHEIADYARRRLDQLPGEYKRFHNPHIYKVGLSDKLNDLRNTLRQQYKPD